MLKKVLLGIVAVAVLAVVFCAWTASKQPAQYRVERSIEIEAPTTVVFAQISDLKKWAAWSPWEKKDPEMKMSFSETTSGVGAFSAWESKSEGKGKQTISADIDNQELRTHLEFV